MFTRFLYLDRTRKEVRNSNAFSVLVIQLFNALYFNFQSNYLLMVSIHPFSVTEIFYLYNINCLKCNIILNFGFYVTII